MENASAAPRLPRKRRSLAQELVTVLSEQIRDGQLKRGDKLPTESAIMEAHGVSRTVVREAISRLQAAGAGRDPPWYRHLCAGHAQPQRFPH